MDQCQFPRRDGCGSDENIIILGDLEETDAAAIAAQKALGEHAANEIARITSVHGVAI